MKRNSNGHDNLRVFIGTSPGGEDAEACMTLVHSIKSRASIPVDIIGLKLESDDPADVRYSDPKIGAGWNTEQWATPWTALRWTVPEACGWAGRAVYFDCPSIVFGDVAELASAPIPRGAFVLLRRMGSSVGTACAVFDCAEARKHLPRVNKMQADVGAHQAVGALLDQRPALVGVLPGDWGGSEAEFYRRQADAPLGGSVHFPSPLTQPHAARALTRLSRAGKKHWYDGVRLPHYSKRLVELFEKEYAGALAAGHSVEQYVPESAAEFYDLLSLRPPLGKYAGT